MGKKVPKQLHKELIMNWNKKVAVSQLSAKEKSKYVEMQTRRDFMIKIQE